MNKEEEKELTKEILQLIVVLSVFLWIYSYWNEIVEFIQNALWITFFVLIALLALSITVWMLNRYGVINFHPWGGSLRRFKKWHILKRIFAYRADPQKLSNAVQNIDHLDELNAKVEHRSLTNMAHELKEAEQDYDQAIKRCNGSKAAEKAVKEAYAQRCSRIREKYNA